MTRSRLVLYCLITVCLLSAQRVYSHDFPMLHYTVEDGLPSNTVYQVYRDMKGFLWVATDKGVARYNGIKFETFTTFDGLPDNEVFLFQEDGYGRLWLGCFNGDLCYYSNDTFHTAANTPFLKLPFRTSHTTFISTQADSSIIMTFRDQSKFLNVQKDRYTVINVEKAHDRLSMTGYLQGFLYRKKINDNLYGLIGGNGISIMVDSNGNIQKTDSLAHRYLNVSSCQGQEFIYDTSYLYNLKSNARLTINRNVNLGYLRTVYSYNGNIFYATKNGLYINDTIAVLNNMSVSSISRNEGNIWVSTLGNGIYAMKDDFSRVTLYKNIYKGVAKYASAAKNKHLFYATADNKLFHLENGKNECLFDYKSLAGTNYQFAVSSACCIDSNNRYYNVCNNAFVVIDDLLAPKLKIKTLLNNLTVSYKEMIPARNCVYVQSTFEITRFNYGQSPASKAFKQEYTTNHNERIFAFAAAPDNTIWFSTIDKMYTIGANGGEKVLQSQFKNIELKYFIFFRDCMIGYNHTNQLLICNNLNGKVVLDSVPAQNCIWDKFYRLDSVHILISTNGMYRLLTFDAKTKKFSLSAIENPYVPLLAECICSDSGNCYFFKDGSITAFPIQSLFTRPEAPRLFFSYLKTVKGSYRINDELQIPFSEAKNIGISFSVLSFSGKNVFSQYSISKDGQDSWKSINSEELNLFNLGFGDYIVKIRARTISGEYSVPILFSLHVSRPYWATWWFMTVATCMLAGLIGVLFRLRILFVLKQKEKEHDSEVRFMKSEYKALNALMNPHFIFNTLNNVQSLFNDNNKLAANRYLRIFADLIRQNMHNVSKGLISLEQEMELVKNYLLLEKLRFEDDLVYTITIDERIDLAEIMIPPLLIQPLVENSIKHGVEMLNSVCGFIYVSIYEEDSILHIEIKDNGVGLSHKNVRSPLHESYGLDNIRKRIAQLGVMQGKNITFDISEVKDTTDEQQWTVVTITMGV